MNGVLPTAAAAREAQHVLFTTVSINHCIRNRSSVVAMAKFVDDGNQLVNTEILTTSHREARG